MHRVKRNGNEELDFCLSPSTEDIKVKQSRYGPGQALRVTGG